MPRQVRRARRARASILARIPAPAPGQQAADAGSGSLVGATLHTATPAATLLALVSALEARGIDLQELHLQKASLEDVFMDVTDAASPMESST